MKSFRPQILFHTEPSSGLYIVSLSSSCIFIGFSWGKSNYADILNMLRVISYCTIFP